MSFRKTPKDQIAKLVGISKEAFSKDVTKSYDSRIKNLKTLADFLMKNKDDFYKALQKDLKMNELACYNEIDEQCRIIDEAISNLSSWMKTESVSTPYLQLPGSCKLVKEPFGCVLIIAPWNYPVSLITKPLIGAIAAGCSAVIKPSEISQNVATVFGDKFKKHFPGDEYQIVEGGPEETTELLKCRFDKIFFTGATSIGKIIMKAAAEHLTPVSLELGGKCPVVIDEDSDLSAAANRIVWGKFLNCGQTCIAPDYILIHKKRKDEFLDKCKASLKSFYGENPKQSNDYGRIISERHFDRLTGLLEKQENKILIKFGENDKSDRFFAPTFVDSPALDSKLMTEEIFGPILPILTIDSVDEAIKFILDTKEKPLASYIFSNNTKTQEKFLEKVSSGGACVNETIMHVLCDSLPFGGVGSSGMGAYNGKLSFDEFTHIKGVLTKATWSDPSVRYPPYTPTKLTVIKFLQNLKLGKLLYVILPVIAFILYRILFRK